MCVYVSMCVYVILCIYLSLYLCECVSIWLYVCLCDCVCVCVYTGAHRSQKIRSLKARIMDDYKSSHPVAWIQTPVFMIEQ